jgi:hypothetical protein
MEEPLTLGVRIVAQPGHFRTPGELLEHAQAMIRATNPT